MLQAQEALQLSEGAVRPFRHTAQGAAGHPPPAHQQARNQILGELRKLTNPQTGSADEAAMTERLRALRDEDDAAAGRPPEGL